MIKIETIKYRDQEEWFTNYVFPIIKKKITLSPANFNSLKTQLANYKMSSSDLDSDDFWKSVIINPFSESSRSTFPLIDEFLSLYELFQRNVRYLQLMYKYEGSKEGLIHRQYYQKLRINVLKDFFKPFMFDIIANNKLEYYAENNKNYKALFIKMDKNLSQITSLINFFVNYDFIGKDKKMRIQLIKELNCQVCPFCNRQYISTLERKKSGAHTLASLDHFVPKAAFPLFSLSLYNLVPVCRSCNSTFKCESFLPIPSPISDNGNDSTFFNFEYNTLSALVGMSTDLQIKGDQSTFENFLLNELFLLEEQYEFHKKDVQNFNRRKVLINSAYKKGYKKIFSTTPYSDDDIDRIIFGFPSDDSEIFEKPLSKLHLDLFRSNPTL